MKDEMIENKKPNNVLSVVSEWWSWLILLAAGITIFFMRVWSLHFLIKFGILFALSVVMVIDMGGRESNIEIISDDDIEEEFKEQSKNNSTK